MTAQRFPQKDVDELLTACHRRCCICLRFCGVKIETPNRSSLLGRFTLANAIWVPLGDHHSTAYIVHFRLKPRKTDFGNFHAAR
jgi:hypothetical protein